MWWRCWTGVNQENISVPPNSTYLICTCLRNTYCIGDFHSTAETFCSPHITFDMQLCFCYDLMILWLGKRVCTEQDSSLGAQREHYKIELNCLWRINSRKLSVNFWWLAEHTPPQNTMLPKWFNRQKQRPYAKHRADFPHTINLILLINFMLDLSEGSLFTKII